MFVKRERERERALILIRELIIGDKAYGNKAVYEIPELAIKGQRPDIPPSTDPRLAKLIRR